MKNNNNCVKCSSSEVYIVPAHKNHYGGTVGKGIIMVALVRRHLCLSCGYSEEWVSEKKDLEEIKEYALKKGWKKKGQ